MIDAGECAIFQDLFTSNEDIFHTVARGTVDQIRHRVIKGQPLGLHRIKHHKIRLFANFNGTYGILQSHTLGPVQGGHLDGVLGGHHPRVHATLLVYARGHSHLLEHVHNPR